MSEGLQEVARISGLYLSVIIRGRSIRIFLVGFCYTVLMFIPTGCERQGGVNLTSYPFKSGDFFQYQKPQAMTNAMITRTFRIESSGSGFVVRRFQKISLPNGESTETQLKNSEKVYDKYGRLQKLADGRGGGRCQGNFCFLWLPPDNRSIGSEVRISENAMTLTVKEAVTRGNRNVLVIRYGNATLYYDAGTGLLVERSTYGPLTGTNRKDLL